MSEESENQPFSESHLNSPEYRERLMRKLNTLIAWLEVATAEVRRSLAGPAADVEKLRRIRKNLRDTLDVCLRARTALEQHGKLTPAQAQDLARINPQLAKSVPLNQAARQLPPKRQRGASVEMTSKAELKRFKQLGRIQPEMIWTCDLDTLARQLQF
jgi:hypothetical protein